MATYKGEEGNENYELMQRKRLIYAKLRLGEGRGGREERAEGN
jgi:hypothetical protein